MNTLYDRFLPVVTIDARNGELVFRRGESEVQAPPVARVGENARILQVGEPAARLTSGRAVHFLRDIEPDAPEACRVFCRRLLARVLGPLSLRPRILLLAPAIRREFGARAVGLLVEVLESDRYRVEMAEGA